MLLNFARRMLACYLFVTGFILLQLDTARAQAVGQLSEKPIAIFYAKDMSQKRSYAYAMNLCERMDFAQSFRRHFAQSQDIEETEPIVQDSVDGYLTYLVSGPIPRVKSLSFCSVADAAAAKSLFEAGFKKGGSESGKLIEMDNGGFIVERTEQFTRPLPEDADEAKIVRNGRVARSKGPIHTINEVKTTIEERSGKRVIVQTTTSRSFHRVYDHFLYEGESEKLFDMTLPSAADISAGLRESNDLGFCVYLAHQNSCLWFAMGGENAKEIIRLSAARCDESNATRTPFVSARIDMERWLAYPQDDPAGMVQMPHWLDSNAWWFPPNPIVLMNGMEAPGRKPLSIMQRAFDLGGSQVFSLTLEADASGLLLQMSLGKALANHLLARMIDRLDKSESSEAGSSKE